jgi:hypothetical protein
VALQSTDKDGFPMRAETDVIVANSDLSAEGLKSERQIRVRLMKPSAGFEDRLSTNTLVCLNFKVPLRIRQQFKIGAARQNMTMTDLLMRLLNDYLNSEAN